MNYLKLLFFYTIGVIDSLINFVCAVFHFYPSLEMAQEYLVSKELKRIGGEIEGRGTTRVVHQDQADQLVAQAKKLDQQNPTPIEEN